MDRRALRLLHIKLLSIFPRDVTFAQRERWDAIGQVRLDRGDGSQVHVLFARNGEVGSAEIDILPNSQGTLLDNLW